MMIRFLALSFIAFLSTPFPAQADLTAMHANMGANEGAGLLRSDLKGALPKGLWYKQNRSEIVYMLQNLPTAGLSRAVQDIKRNMLLSYYDTSVITNDIDVKEGEDLLTLRLQKLMEMGLWEDALKLYTKTIEDPGQNSKLAQVGLLLILNQRGLSTACLEEKVLYPRFSDAQFWQQIDKVCNIELGTEDGIDQNFPESPVLQALFFDKNFKITAKDVENLNNLTPLEISLLSLKGRIDYNNIDLSKNMPPFLLKIFSEDKKFPDKYKSALKNQKKKQGLAPESPLSDKQKDQLKNTDSLTQSQIIELIASQLRLNHKISKELGNRLLELANDSPENYYFLQLLEKTNFIYGKTAITEDNFALGQKRLQKKYPQSVILLQSALDKPARFSNNPNSVYEKQISLTPDDGYVMSMDSLTKWLEKTTTHRLAGLSLLIILSNDEEIAKGIKGSNLIKSLSIVGLINQAHHIAKEELARLMESTL